MAQAQPTPAPSGFSFTDLLSGTFTSAPDLQRKILLSVGLLVGLWILRRVAMRVVRKQISEPRALYHWGKATSYVATVAAVLLVGPIWLEGVGSVGTFLGLLTAGVAIALKEPLADLAGWGFILWRKPFQLGDRVQIGDVSGDVVDIRLFEFTVLEIGNWVDADQSTGRVVHVPNARLFSQPLANSTQHFPYIWHEIPVLITFESNVEKARSLIESVVNEVGASSEYEVREAMRRASERFLIFYKNISPIVYLTVQDSGVLLTARYLCNPRARRGTTEEFWTRILEGFAVDPELDLAYPTYRIIKDDGA